MSVHRFLTGLLGVVLVFGVMGEMRGQDSSPAVYTGQLNGGGTVDSGQGWEFRTESPILVNSLGLFDRWTDASPNHNPGLVHPHEVAIWDAAEPLNPIVSTTIPAGTTAQLVENFRYVSVEPVLLLPGRDYVIGAYYPDHISPDSDMLLILNGDDRDLAIFAPEIQFVARRFSWEPGGILTFLDITDPSAVGAFGPNFAFHLFTPPNPFTATDFEPPMGHKKKLGSTLPVKFQLFVGDDEMQSPEEIGQALGLNQPIYPKILITEVDAGSVELPEDAGNVGDGGDLGDSFRYSDGRWIFNLGLPEHPFFSETAYLITIEVGPFVMTPGNNLFEIK